MPYHHCELEDLLEDLLGDISDIGYMKECGCGKSCELWNETSESILTLTTFSVPRAPILSAQKGFNRAVLSNCSGNRIPVRLNSVSKIGKISGTSSLSTPY